MALMDKSQHSNKLSLIDVTSPEGQDETRRLYLGTKALSSVSKPDDQRTDLKNIEK